MQVSTGHVTTPDSVRLHYTLVGNGTPTVIVPNGIYMLEDLPGLAADRCVVFYDLRNRGLSDAVTEPQQLSRGVHHDVDDLETIRAHFDIGRVSVVAHSYTGVFAALYAMQHPGRVSRVIQIAPPPADMQASIPAELRLADATSVEMMTKLQELQRQPGTDPAAQCRAAWTIMRPFYVGRPEDVTKISHWGRCDLANERNMLQYFYRCILPSLQALTLTAEDYARARMPVLVIHGTRDRSAPYGGGVAWARSLPQARLMTIDGAGHAPHIEAVERVLPAMTTFLAGNWPADAAQP